jgi:4-carboxymuconolactone decarboxylase
MASQHGVPPGQDRMPPIPDEALTPQQKAVSDELISGPRGKLAGPFVPLLRSPELMRRVQKLGEYLRFESALPARIKELAILVVARRWSQGYEWSFHLPLALKEGVERATAEAIAAGRAPSGLTAEEQAAYDLLTELNASKAVGDDAYARARALFGEAGVVDLVAFNGYYALLAMVMNTARTPAEEAEIPLKFLLP